MRKYKMNLEKDNNRYQVHSMDSPNRPKTNFRWIYAQNIESALKKANALTTRTYIKAKNDPGK